MKSFLFFIKRYVLHASFLLIQDNPFFWTYSGKISLWWKHILIHTDTHLRKSHNCLLCPPVVCMHAWQRWCIHWITFWMLRCWVSFCFSIRQLRNIYWRWYPVFHAIAYNTLTYPMRDITAGMKGYSITYMSFVCRTFSVKRVVWAGAPSCWNTLHRPPPTSPAPLRRSRHERHENLSWNVISIPSSINISTQ